MEQNWARAQVPTRPAPKPDRPTGRAKCRIHEKERLKRYCKACKVPLCIDCLADDIHLDHKSEICKIDDVFKTIQNRVCEIFDKVNVFNSKNIQPTMDDLKHSRKKSRAVADETIQAIILRNEELKRYLDSATDNLVQKVEKFQKKFEEDLGETERVAKDMREGIVKSMREADDVIQNGSKLDVLLAYADLCAKYYEMPFIPTVPSIKSAKFVPRPIQKRKIERLLGEVQEPRIRQKSIDGTVAVINEFICTDTPVNAFVPLDGQVWIHEDGSGRVQLLTLESMTVAIEFDVKMEIEDMVRTKTGDIIMTSSSDRRIRRLEGATGEIYFFGENKMHLIPKGLCVTASKSERVVVCMVDEDDDHPNQKSRRLLQLYDSYGCEIKQIEFDNDEKRLFTNPSRVAVNQKGNYCVIDTNRVLIVHKDGHHLMYTYAGQSNDCDFEPEDIICDEKGNLVVIEGEGRIHILDATGQLLHLIKSWRKNDNDLYAIANGLDGTGHIWLGCDNGVVVTEIMHDDEDDD